MKTVYMSFSTDMLHSGHIAIIEKAAALGQLTIGVLTDQVIASYKRYPLLSYEERVNMLQSIRGVYRTVEQNSLSYADNLRKLRPDYVVHGDDWKSGVQKPIRDEVVSILNANWWNTLTPTTKDIGLWNSAPGNICPFRIFAGDV